MYVRQFKQYVRGVDPAFDERKLGFTTIMEFLRLVQREGLFRLERDRRGQIRVFPGSPANLLLSLCRQPSRNRKKCRRCWSRTRLKCRRPSKRK